MLTDVERNRIMAEVGRVPDKRAAVSEALMIVQESRGWVSDEGVADIARALDLSREEIEGVATAFELVFRRPVGKHVIMVCDSVSCWIRGSASLFEHLKSRLGIALGETTADGLFTLLPVACLGACEQAPVMSVDGVLYGELDAFKIDEILGRLRGGAHADSAH
jgi:NADH-quinone oxidoreductase subunit E